MIRVKSSTHSARVVHFFAFLLAAAFFAACSGSSNSSSTPGEAFEGEITSRMFMGDEAMETRLSIKGARNRLEPLLSQDDPLATIVIIDTSSGALTSLFPQTKSYASLNVVELAEEQSDASGDDSSIFPKVTSTGETETIAGFTCRHWLVSDNGQEMDVCMAKGLGYFGGGAGGILDRIQDPALREKAKAQIDANPEFAKFVEGGAFPLKIAVIENGRPRTIMEVTRVERKSLDDSLFTVPAGYSKTELH